MCVGVYKCVQVSMCICTMIIPQRRGFVGLSACQLLSFAEGLQTLRRTWNTYAPTCHTLSVSTLSASGAFLCLPAGPSQNDVCEPHVTECEPCVISVHSPLIDSAPMPHH